MVDANAIYECACGTQLPARLLSCPSCGRLPHAERLKELVAEADRARERGDLRGEAAALRNALERLPGDSRQHEVIRARVAELSEMIDAGLAPNSKEPADRAAPGAEKSRHKLLKVGSAVGLVALLAWKFKFILVFLATKAKLLLLGLSKSTTLFTMLLSLGVYWAAWGWKFGLGVVLSIYVHEMGHVAELRKFGIRATAPMFLPGLGAMVRLHQYPQTAREDARVGLAGPIWGLGASIATLLLYYVTQLPIIAAIATVGAWINLFNLLPVWQLDGARGFRSLSRPQRWIALAVIAATWIPTQEGMLVLLGIGAAFQCFAKNAPSEGDLRGLVSYAGLVVALALLAGIPVPEVASP
ncbi:MAG: site-2 protease family protein [Deltaproteobacteria bacterium]|nr:site-2 protease family protein [Deltaproteobacteria bacterium]